MENRPVSRYGLCERIPVLGDGQRHHHTEHHQDHREDQQVVTPGRGRSSRRRGGAATHMQRGEPDRLITRMSTTCVTNPQKPSIAAIEIAPPASTPLRPKNRTSRANRAAELGIASAMNWMAYSSIRTGRNRMGRNDAPSVPKASATGITIENASAMASQTKSADANSSIRLS